MIWCCCGLCCAVLGAALARGAVPGHPDCSNSPLCVLAGTHQGFCIQTFCLLTQDSLDLESLATIAVWSACPLAEDSHDGKWTMLLCLLCVSLIKPAVMTSVCKSLAGFFDSSLSWLHAQCSFATASATVPWSGFSGSCLVARQYKKSVILAISIPSELLELPSFFLECQWMV